MLINLGVGLMCGIWFIIGAALLYTSIEHITEKH
jgi:hypothetical protein